jgi:hypothetical protein
MSHFFKTVIGFGFLYLTACSHSAITSRGLATPISSQENKCEITAQEKEALLKLDYQSFDQTLPDGGWRKYGNIGCNEITRDLLDAYTEAHLPTLLDWQKDILVWHSGQISGELNDYPRAISQMERTMKPNEKPTDAFLWNPYARATIAFLKKDKKSLLSERTKLARGSSPFNHINLRKVDAFIRCFNSTYHDAYSETCEPKATNTDKIKSLAIKLNPRKSFPEGLATYLKDIKIIILGEIHGTKQVPELFSKMVQSVADEKSKTLVILEINQSSQDSIDRFLKSGDESILKQDEFFYRKYQDGRSSKAMVNLLKDLAKMPNVAVLCMDPMTGINTMTGQERDTAMATFINSKRIGYDRVLVLSGNVHSSAVVGTPWDKDFKPMTYELKTMATDLAEKPPFGIPILNILVRYEKVSSWNCQGAEANSCSARYGKKIPTDYSTALNWESYFMLEDSLTDGHRGSIFIRSTDASFPFMPSK